MAIQWKFGVRPASFEKWAEYEKALLNNDIEALKELGTMVLPPVGLVPHKFASSSPLDQGGYLTFKVLPETPAYVIHHLIDKSLNRFLKDHPAQVTALKKLNTGQRFRKEKITAFKVWELRTMRKSFSRIAKEHNMLRFAI